jgi:hypothetical protein
VQQQAHRDGLITALPLQLSVAEVSVNALGVHLRWTGAGTHRAWCAADNEFLGVRGLVAL